MSRNFIEKSFKALFSQCFDALKFYSCPETCEAFCCTLAPISFESYEYKKIVNKFPQAKAVLAAKTESSPYNVRGCTGVSYSFTDPVCPFLKANRCSIQPVKPTVCKLYPIMPKAQGSEYLTVDPCPVGIEFMKDYVLFKAIMLTQQYPEDPQVPEIIKKDVELLQSVIERSRDFQHMKTVPLMYIPLNTFKGFADFLKKTNLGDRLHDRKEIGID